MTKTIKTGTLAALVGVPGSTIRKQILDGIIPVQEKRNNGIRDGDIMWVQAEVERVALAYTIFDHSKLTFREAYPMACEVLSDEYPDRVYIVRTGLKRERDYMVFYDVPSFGSYSIIDVADVLATVHEVFQR